MKKKLYFGMFIAFLAVACSKEWSPNHLELEEKETFSSFTSMSSELYPIEQNSSGVYRSLYAGGIQFGTSFIYPSSVPLGSQGQFYNAIIDEFNATLMVSYYKSGPHFNFQTAGYGFIPDMTYLSACSTYNSHFDEYILGLRSSLAPFSSYYSGTGVTNTTGTFVYDSNSETNVSVRSFVRTLLLIE